MECSALQAFEPWLSQVVRDDEVISVKGLIFLVIFLTFVIWIFSPF